MFIRPEIKSTDVPDEFVRMGFAHLEGAERLNSDLVTAAWSGSYQHGQVVMWLAFHACELFLKGFCLMADASTQVTGHTLQKLRSELERRAGPVEFDLPFGGEAPEEYEHLVRQYERTTHERFRYPTNRDGLPWEGIVGFTPELFASTLQHMRTQAQHLHARLTRDDA